jgi:hypothetical protein
MVDTIQKKEHWENRKNKSNGVSGENSREETKGQQIKRGGVDVLRYNLVTWDTSQSPITPYVVVVPGTVVAANVGHDPSCVSSKQLLTAVLKTSLSVGANTAELK